MIINAIQSMRYTRGEYMKCVVFFLVAIVLKPSYEEHEASHNQTNNLNQMWSIWSFGFLDIFRTFYRFILFNPKHDNVNICCVCECSVSVAVE